jgi:hypothetical protein
MKPLGLGGALGDQLGPNLAVLVGERMGAKVHWFPRAAMGSMAPAARGSQGRCNGQSTTTEAGCFRWQMRSPPSARAMRLRAGRLTLFLPPTFRALVCGMLVNYHSWQRVAAETAEANWQ